MSLETWKQEFYSVDAVTVPAEEALEHSLRKWRGLRREAMERHGMNYTKYKEIEQDDSSGRIIFDITSETCALCFHYRDETQGFDSYCGACPLTAVRGVACDRLGPKEMSDGTETPYGAFVYKYDPEPMIQLLERALEAQHGDDPTD